MPAVILPADWAVADEIISKGTRRVLLYGPPGTGKTFAGRHLGVKPGQRVYNTYVGEDTPAYDVIGHDVVHEGSMTFRYGPGPLSWTTGTGCRYVINELDKASGDTLDALLAICDDPDSAGFVLPNGEYIEPGPDWQCVATMNGEPEDLPEAMASRFSVRVRIERPNPHAILALPADLRPLATKLTAPRIEEDRRLNLRQFAAYAEMREKGVSDKHAAAAAFHSQAEAILDAIAVGNATS